MRKLYLLLLGLSALSCYLGTILFIKEIILSFDKNIPTLISEINEEKGAVLGQTHQNTAGIKDQAENFLKEFISDKKRIYIDLTKQELYAYDSDKLIHKFTISSGIKNKTPTGTFRIWIKLAQKDMSGGSTEENTLYDYKNVPYAMFFYNEKVARSEGFGIHGAYWHNNFGQPMSIGCINMKPEDAKKIYYWVDPFSEGKETNKYKQGTQVIIYGESS